MTAINRFTALIAATGAAFVAQATLAGPGCNQSGMTPFGYRLTYHVVPGRVEAAKVVTLSSAVTVEGQPLKIQVRDSVMVNNARVLKTDISTSNGVIHVIDTVMLPPDMVSQR